MKKILYILILLGFLIAPATGISYLTLSWIFPLFVFLRTLWLFSKTSIILDIISLYSCILYLIGPFLSYTFFNATFQQAVIFDFVMPVDAQTYFEYVYPAIIIFIIALNLFRPNTEPIKLKKIISDFMSLGDPRWVPTILMVSIPAFYLRGFMPSVLQYVTMLIFLMIFPAMTLLIKKKKKSQKDRLILIAVSGWILINGIKSTMFTIVFYMGVTLISIVLIGRNYSFIKKLIFSFIFLLFTMTLQYTKNNIRALIRNNMQNEISFVNFGSLYLNNLRSIEEVFNIQNIFPLTLRFNNGFFLGLVMNHIPDRKPFDHGKVLGAKIISTFVPRLFWPNKPEAGGIANMKYYADLEVRHTVNVGPIGEAYGSFGVKGGIAFMFLFGLFLSFAHNKFIALACKTPMLFMWMPMVFYESLYCMENDTMQAMNSLIKISVFLFIVFRIFPTLLGKEEKTLYTAKPAVA